MRPSDRPLVPHFGSALLEGPGHGAAHLLSLLNRFLHQTLERQSSHSRCNKGANSSRLSHTLSWPLTSISCHHRSASALHSQPHFTALHSISHSFTFPAISQWLHSSIALLLCIPFREKSVVVCPFSQGGARLTLGYDM